MSTFASTRSQSASVNAIITVSSLWNTRRLASRLRSISLKNPLISKSNDFTILSVIAFNCSHTHDKQIMTSCVWKNQPTVSRDIVDGHCWPSSDAIIFPAKSEIYILNIAWKSGLLLLTLEFCVKQVNDSDTWAQCIIPFPGRISSAALDLSEGLTLEVYDTSSGPHSHAKLPGYWQQYITRAHS